MSDLDEGALLEHIMWAEGFRSLPYRCSAGKLTIGYGRNIEDNGISKAEAQVLLRNDMGESIRSARTLHGWGKADPVRRLVIADMVYNMGLGRVKKFRNMLAAFARQDYRATAAEMKDSRWYDQVGRRAWKLVEAMQTGEWDG